MSEQLIAPKALTPEKLLDVFKGAGMESELMEDGDVMVTSTIDLAQYGSPSGGPGAGELVVKKKNSGGFSAAMYVETSEAETRPLDPVLTFVRRVDLRAAPTDGEFSHVRFQKVRTMEGLDPGDSDNQARDFCNRVNRSQRFTRAWALEGTDQYVTDWFIPVIGTGISAQSLVRALQLFAHAAGAIQRGEYD